MFIELIDALRCPADHAPSTLVAAIDTLTDRDVVEGMLGCPICRSEFAIRQGQLWLVTNAMPAPRTRAVNPADDGLRLAASLDLRHEEGFAILRGAWCALADAVAEVAPTHLMLLDPPFELRPQRWHSVIHSGGTVPFAPRSAVAATIDDDERAFALASVVKPDGRVVGPLNVRPPVGVRELTRDERWWVGAKENVSEPVALRRA